MPLRVLLIAVTFSAYALGGPQMPKNEHATSETKAQEPENIQRPIPPRHVIIDPSVPAPNGPQPKPANGQGEATEKPLPRFIRPEWIIVYVTAAYCWITWRILKTIKRQADTMDRQATEARQSSAQQMQGVQASIAEATRAAKAMEGIAASMATSVEAAKENVRISRETADAAIATADATKDSALAMINSQRAWVVIHPGNPAPEVIAAIPGAARAPEIAFAFRIWNKGKTTATKVKVFSRYVLLNKMEDLPETPQYGPAAELPNGALIPTDKAEDVNAFWSYRRLEPNAYLFQDDVDAITKQEKFLYAYGIVIYDNGVGGEGSTCFGLVYNFPLPGDWHPKGFLHCGPPAYNKIT